MTRKPSRLNPDPPPPSSIGWQQIDADAEQAAPQPLIDGHADGADQPVWFRVVGSVPRSEALARAQAVAFALGRAIDVVDRDGERVMEVLPRDPPQPSPAVRRYWPHRDWTVRPEPPAGANPGVERLLRDIEAARGDLSKLRQFIGNFRGSLGTDKEFSTASSAYKAVSKYLWTLIQEAVHLRKDMDE